eukprot:283076-Pyramimonas_sp.AAC.1
MDSYKPLLTTALLFCVRFGLTLPMLVISSAACAKGLGNGGRFRRTSCLTRTGLPRLRCAGQAA